MPNDMNGLPAQSESQLPSCQSGRIESPMHLLYVDNMKFRTPVTESATVSCKQRGYKRCLLVVYLGQRF